MGMTQFQWMMLFGAVGFLVADLVWWAGFLDSIYHFIKIMPE